MRPLIIDLGRDYRGGQHQAFILSQGLLVLGHQPEIVTVRDSLLAGRALNAGVRVHLVSANRRRLDAVVAIHNLLSESPPDIIHANEPHALTAAWIARAHRRVPLITSRRVIFPLSRGRVSLARYRAAARIVAVSQCVADAVAASGIPREQLIVIHDGVAIPPLRSGAEGEAARQSLGIAPGIPLLGCVSVLTPDKGQDILIRALPTVRAAFPKCELLLAGTGPCLADLRALTNDLGLNAAVHFVGFVENLERIYQATDVFLFPAQAEALGTALLSAMAYGLPVVAAARGGIPEAVENDKNGLLVESPESEKWATGMKRLLSNPAEANRFGAAARETICARFSAEQMLNATLVVYESLSRKPVKNLL